MVRTLWFGVLFGVFGVACGSDDGGPNSNGGDGLLSQAPHCPALEDFRVEGTLDGVAIDDQRSTDVNAGLVNFGSPTFDTPVTNLAKLAPNQIELHLTWKDSLFFGSKGPLTGKSLRAPIDHPRSGEAFCITAGEVGFVDGGSEDGVFKFRITKAKAGADCSVDVPVDLRGCMN